MKQYEIVPGSIQVEGDAITFGSMEEGYKNISYFEVSFEFIESQMKDTGKTMESAISDMRNLFESGFQFLDEEFRKLF